MKYIKLLYLTVLFFIFIFSGCSDKSSSSNQDIIIETTTETFKDSFVIGLEYSYDTITYFTDSNGQFTYETGKTITFKVGHIILGSSTLPQKEGLRFPQDLVGVSLENTLDERVLNIAIFLQSLDNDNDPSNGIEITRDIIEILSSSLSEDEYVQDMSIERLSEIITLCGKAMISKQMARDHLNGTMMTHGITPLEEADPTVISVTVPVNNTYTQSNNLDFIVNLSENITVVGIPRLIINIGETSKNAIYINGNGTSILTFRYVIESNLEDTDGISLDNTIDLNGGTLKDDEENDLLLTLNGIEDLLDVKVDSVILLPIITSINVPINNVYIEHNNLNFTININKNITVVGTPRLTINIGGTTKYATLINGNGTSTLTFRYLIEADLEDLDGISLENFIDLNGATLKDDDENNLSTIFDVPDLTNVRVDSIVPMPPQPAPSVTSVNIPANNTYIESNNLDFTVNLSENITVIGIPRLTININGISKNAIYFHGSETSTLTFRYVVESNLEDTDGISLTNLIDLNGGTLKDNEGNNLTLTLNNIGNLENVKLDSIIPTITSITILGTPNINDPSITFKAIFSESITNLNISDFETTLTNSANGTIASMINNGDNSYNITVTSITGDGTIRLDLKNIHNITDNANNSLIGGFNTGSVHTINRVAPTITNINIPANNTYIESNNLDFTINTDENIIVIGTPRLILNIGGTTKYATYINGTGTQALVFRYTIELNLEDNNGIEINDTIDLNGSTLKGNDGNDLVNTLNVPNLSNILVNSIPAPQADPTITSINAPANNYYTLNSNLNFIINTSENITVTGIPRLTLDINGTTKYAIYISGDGTQTLTFRYIVENNIEDTDGIGLNNTIDLNSGSLKDSDENNLALTFNVPDLTNVKVDSIIPTVQSITVVGNPVATDDNVTFKITFSESILNIDTNDFATTFTNSASGTIDSITDNGDNSYNIVVNSLTGGGDLRLDLKDTHNITDNATNNIDGGFNTGSVHTINRVVPTVTSVDNVPANNTYGLGVNWNFTVNFSENVTVTNIPRLTINIGGTTKYANYLNGTGTQALVFQYTTEVNLEDYNGITLTDLNLNTNGLIQSAVGNNANLTLNSIGDLVGVRIDTVAPTFTSANSFNKCEAQTTFIDGSITVTATDESTNNGGAAITYSIVNELNSDKFTYGVNNDAINGFILAPNYDAPDDETSYQVTIKATDEVGNEANQTITVNISNKDDENNLELSKVVYDNISDKAYIYFNKRIDESTISQNDAGSDYDENDGVFGDNSISTNTDTYELFNSVKITSVPNDFSTTTTIAIANPAGLKDYDDNDECKFYPNAFLSVNSTKIKHILQTGLIQSYKNGDDFYNRVLSTNRNFTRSTITLANNDEINIVIDNINNLTWQNNERVLQDWQDATDYCDALDFETVYNNWRLPTAHELTNIINYEYSATSRGNWVKSDIFDIATDENYWTSTSELENQGSASAWIVQFAVQHSLTNVDLKTNTNYTRCVRDN